MINAKKKLPLQFKELEVYLAEWCFPTQMERTNKRQESNMEEIKGFYHAIEPKIQEILDYLDTFSLDSLGEEEQTLLDLSYSLAEVAPAVEMFNQKYVTATFDARDFLPTHEPVLKRSKMSIAPKY
jgi:regulator of sigma D